MGSAEAFPIALSLRVAAISLCISAPVGIALAWVQARRRYPLRGFVSGVVALVAARLAPRESPA